ncbi:MAG TPA: glycosyltransferase family 2 protein [Anaerolineales bacterium]|nr:glycosyltransferase family 2 protein [Anaerolineales bacterium]
MTLVSIVTPSFNQSAYLEQTIRSVLEQGYPDVEYIVMDGASTDGSADIIRKYSSRLAYWVSEKDSGQADAINKGMRRARGEIAAWLNSDDCYLPGALQSAAAAFEANPQATMVYGDMLAVDQTGQTTNQLRYRQLTLEDLLCFQIIGQPAVFMRRAAFEKANGLDVNFHFMLDHQLWIKLAAQGPIVHVNQTWSAARYHPQAKNRLKAAEFGREAFRILDWAGTRPDLAPILQPVRCRARASAYRVDARYLLDDGQSWNALKAWVDALSIHPPTALARLNLLGSSLLNLIGLNRIRIAILNRRQRRYQSKIKLL